MSFLKKHWRFTVPAVVVFCVLLICVVALYSTSKPPEPRTVYVLPERSSSDNPPALNTGGIATLAPAQSADTNGAAELPTDDFVSDTESLESCCPEEELLDENASGENPPPGYHVHHSPSPEAIEDARKYREWSKAYMAFMKEDDKLHEEWDRLTAKIEESFRKYRAFIYSDEGRTSSLAEIEKRQAEVKKGLEERQALRAKMDELELRKPEKPIYTSHEYTTSH